MRPLAALLALLALASVSSSGTLARRPTAVGGEPANLKEWPAVGTLRYYNAQSRTSGHVCGGSMIAPTWFLTAAHCVARHAEEKALVGTYADDTGGALEGTLEVVLGQENLKSLTPESAYSIAEIVVHDDFMNAYRDARAAGLNPTQAADRATIASGHDIAVVRLKRAWQGELPRLLLQPTEPKQHRWFADVFGFGYTDPSAKDRRMKRYTRANQEVYFAGSSQLMRVNVPLADTARCARRYAAKYASAAIGEGQICAGEDSGGRDSCQGDSGGPLVASYEDRPESYQIALVSWGHGCAEPGWAGIYTRLSTHADWLRATVGELNSRVPARNERPAPPPSANRQGPAIASAPKDIGRMQGAAAPLKVRFANSTPKFWEPEIAGGAEFVEELKKLSAGKIDLMHFSAGELVPGGPPTIDAVTRGGIVEMAWISPAYNWRKSAAFALFGNAVPFGMGPERLAAWMRGEGGQLMWRLFDKYNIHALPCAITGETGNGWFRKPLADVADLRGLKISIGAFHVPIMALAGASPQRLTAEILWPALQDGRLDAALFSFPAADEKLGFLKVAPYYYYPAWHHPKALVTLLVSDQTWAGMDTTQKGLVEEACRQSIERSMRGAEGADARVIARLVSAGAQLQQLSPAVESALRKATDEYFAQLAVDDPDFHAVFESYRRHQAASPIATQALPSTPVDTVAPSVSPSPRPEKAAPARTARKTRKKPERSVKTWRDEVLRPN